MEDRVPGIDGQAALHDLESCGNVESCRANQYLPVASREVGRKWHNSLSVPLLPVKLVIC